MAAILRAQSPQELAAATQRESILRQREALASRAQGFTLAADNGESRTPPAGSTSRAPDPAAPAAGASPSLAAQMASIQRQRSALSQQIRSSIPAAPAPAATPPASPGSHAPPPQQSPPNNEMASSSIALQLRSVALQPRPAPPEPPAPAALLACAPLPPASLSPVFERAAASYGLEPALLRAVARQESAFQPCAVSRAGAMGLMQLMPETAANLGVADPFDPEQSILGGARYLRLLLDRFDNDLALTLAAYNAGPARVESYGGIPPIRETQNYVTRILGRLLTAAPAWAAGP